MLVLLSVADSKSFMKECVCRPGRLPTCRPSTLTHSGQQRLGCKGRWQMRYWQQQVLWGPRVQRPEGSRSA